MQKLKSIVKENLVLYRWALAVRGRIAPTEADRFFAYLLKLTKLASRLVFVKVGANDGITGDPCGELFLRNRKWSGLLIEPVPYSFAKLGHIYSDRSRFRLEQVAIGNMAGSSTFFYVSESAKDALPNLPFYYDQLGSFDRNHIIKHLDGILEPFIVETQVEVSPLPEVLARNNISVIDLLHIDTEGYDLQVLKTIDLSTVTPLAIFIEHRHLSTQDRIEMHTILKNSGYVVRDCGGDFFAVQNKAVVGG
jgi:FkbM family methyltransferase